jgi:hypothetical protein
MACFDIHWIKLAPDGIELMAENIHRGIMLLEH